MEKGGKAVIEGNLALAQLPGYPKGLGKKGDKKKEWRRVEGKSEDGKDDVAKVGVVAVFSSGSGKEKVVPGAPGGGGVGHAKGMVNSAKGVAGSSGDAGSSWGVVGVAGLQGVLGLQEVLGRRGNSEVRWL